MTLCKCNKARKTICANLISSLFGKVVSKIRGITTRDAERLTQETGETNKIVAIVPNIIGFAGDSINERQLIKSLQKYSKVVTYSLLPVSNLGRLMDKSFLRNIKGDVMLRLLLIHVGYPYTIGQLLNVFYGLLLLPLIIMEKPKLVYIRTSGLALIPVMFKKMHRAKVIVKIPSLFEDEAIIRAHPWDLMLLKKILSIIDRYVIYNADKIAVATPLFYYELCKRRRIKSRKGPIIIPAGVDLSRIERLRKNSSSKDKEEFIVGFVGLLEWWQGVDELVKAIHILQKRNTDTKFKLLIIGDGPLRRKIEILCKELNICYEITGFVQHEDALNLMRKMNVLVVPSHRTSTTETVIPIKVIEAWALGIPVIATDHKIFRCLGYLIKNPLIRCEPTSESIARIIKLTIYNERLVEELRVSGLTLARQFDYSAISKRILEVIYREL